MTAFGMLLVVAAVLSYLGLIFVLHRFEYRTWMFDGVIGFGTALALIGWTLGGSGAVALGAVFLGAAWFPVIRRELRLGGSMGLQLRPGDPVPAFTLLGTDGSPFTDQDLIANAPALLELYRGWWCPTSKAQLDEVARDFQSLTEAGLKLYAASVDGPDEAAPLQQHVGDKITILCNVSGSLLDAVGARDTRGAPWYDRILFGAARQDISMPAALVVDKTGKVVFAHRSTRLDEHARPADILASL